MKRLFIVFGICLAVPAIVLPIAAGGMAAKQGRVLGGSEMKSLVGGDGCTECQYSGERIDECYHNGFFGACSTTKCISNYLLEDTCVLGEGTCDASLDNDAIAFGQYVRVDPGCSYVGGDPYAWTVWADHYYGSACENREYSVRCVKPSNACDGTLIASSYGYPGILCN